MAWTNLAAALIGSGTAIYIATSIYRKQKQIDRETAAQDWIRKAASDYLSAFMAVRARWQNPQPTGWTDPEETLARNDLFTKLNLLKIYSGEPISGIAQELFDADSAWRAAVAAYNSTLKSADLTSSKGSAGYERVHACAKKLHDTHSKLLEALSTNNEQYLGRSERKLIWWSMGRKH